MKMKLIKKRKKNIRSDREGTSDKYARMIASWLIKMKLIEKRPKEICFSSGKKEYKMTIGQSYVITPKGRNAIKKSRGNSKHKRIPKVVYWEMLATKVENCEYIRNRRYYILKSLEYKPMNSKDISNYLMQYGVSESQPVIESDLKSLEYIGLELFLSNDKYILKDKIIYLEKLIEIKESKSDILKIKDSLYEKVKNINSKYFSLIDMAYTSSLNRDFERYTIDLFTEELGFYGTWLGGANKPDGVIYHGDTGVILDEKSYSKGCAIQKNIADSMVRYIEDNKLRRVDINNTEWWNNFDDGVKNFSFMFVSSFFKNKHEEQLKNMHKRTNVCGASLSVVNLILYAEEIKKGNISKKEFLNKIFLNQEIKY